MSGEMKCHGLDLYYYPLGAGSATLINRNEPRCYGKTGIVEPDPFIDITKRTTAETAKIEMGRSSPLVLVAIFIGVLGWLLFGGIRK